VKWRHFVGRQGLGTLNIKSVSSRGEKKSCPNPPGDCDVIFVFVQTNGIRVLFLRSLLGSHTHIQACDDYIHEIAWRRCLSLPASSLSTHVRLRNRERQYRPPPKTLSHCGSLPHQLFGDLELLRPETFEDAIALIIAASLINYHHNFGKFPGFLCRRRPSLT
jgi:hypothetical protein